MSITATTEDFPRVTHDEGSQLEEETVATDEGNDADGCDSKAELAGLGEEPENAKKNKVKNNPKFQGFFHTINKNKDDEGTDEEFISRCEGMLNDEWALRNTKGQTLNGLVHMSWVVETLDSVASI